MSTLLYRMDKQGPAIQHREAYSISHDKHIGKNRKKNYIHTHMYAAAAKSPQSCPTLCDPIDGSPLGCPVPGILQGRTLEWGAIAFV